jgi:flagellin-like protein
MILQKMFHSKKAISPILATLLLVVIAVAAIVMTYAWMNSYMGNTTNQASVMPYKANVAFLQNGKSTTITSSTFFIVNLGSLSVNFKNQQSN